MVSAEHTPGTGANSDRPNSPSKGDVAFAYREALLKMKDRMGNDLPHDEIVNECIDLIECAAFKLTAVVNRELRSESAA